jgi:hypothetical protein
MNMHNTRAGANPVSFDPASVAATLISNGYMPVPCTGKRARGTGWQERAFTARDFNKSHNVGIKTGDGIALVDVDVTDPAISAAMQAEWNKRHPGTMQRTGMAPKTAFLVASDLEKKIDLKLPDVGEKDKLEVLAKGQQFVAFGTHPDTQEPYIWHGLDPLDEFLGRKEDLVFVSEAELRDFAQWVKDTYGPKTEKPKLSEQAAKAAGFKFESGGSGKFWRNVNDAALKALDLWVPALLPTAKKQATGAWRVSSRDLGRDLEEDLSIHPDGIQDFGPEAARTPIDLVQEFGGAPDIKAAAFWLCDKMGVSAESLGWSERKPKAVRPDDMKRNPDAQRLAKWIAKRIAEALPDLKEPPEVDELIIQDMIEGAFWSGAKSRLFLLNEADGLIQFGQQEAWKFLCKRFGSPFDLDAILAEWEKSVTEGEGELGQKVKGEARKAVYSVAVDPIVDHLKYHNQRDNLEWRVDMFEKRSHIELREDVARIVLTHQPLDVGPVWDPAIIDDYRQHFPELDSVIEFVVASRFALDRKQSHLWLLADSNWGKGFFMGVLQELGIVVEMSVKEIESVFEGKPAGRSPADFKRAMVLAIDEFKTVKSELKQLQSEITIAPKFQLTSRVEIFTKLYMSAENVGSLVGEYGVEDQFANRMSVIQGRGSILSRPMYEANRGRYFRSVMSYVAREINRLVVEYRAQGREGSELWADRFLSAFIDMNGLGQHFARLSDSIDEIAAEAVSHFEGRLDLVTRNTSSPQLYLEHAGKRVDEYLEGVFAKSELGTIRRRKTDIMRAMCADGKGIYPHWIKGRQVKAIKLKT